MSATQSIAIRAHATSTTGQKCVKERPILFSAPMVLALLDGRKTQTRRAIKPAHLKFFDQGAAEMLGDWNNRPLPYGKPGERLWVCETFIQGWPGIDGNPDQWNEDGSEKPIHTWYRATTPELSWMDDEGGTRENTPWKPSIFMPRAASRITLEVTGVRVERLQDISEDDASAEGVTAGKYAGLDRANARAYSVLWESISGPGSWDLNPLVWVLEFKRVST